MAPTLVLNPAGRKIESPKVLNQPATPILIFFLTISLMFSVCGSEPYDYMQYVVQWQPAVCSNPDNYGWCTKSANQSLTIHGLWPSNFDGARVTKRSREQAFDINELHPIQAELDKCWPNMLGDNDRFWREEWKKHGRYSLNVFGSQFEYFNRAVTLCNMYNERIEEILSGAQIYPSNERKVKSSYIADEILDKLRSRPVVRCSDKYDPDVPSDDSPKQLKEVILCFDVKGEDPIDCPPDPPTRKTYCPIDILFSP
ncbi:hypothetical protein SLA2020_373620 [Shorea laevis]